MRVARTVARVAIALLFLFTGVMGFLMAPTPQPGMMGVVLDVLHRTHWSWFVSLAQIAIGLLLLTNRYVPVALIMLFAFLYNSIAFHAGTSPQFLPLPIVVAGLGVFVGWPYRALFAQLFQAKPAVSD